KIKSTTKAGRPDDEKRLYLWSERLRHAGSPDHNRPLRHKESHLFARWPIFRAEKGSVKLSIPQFDVAVMLQSLAVTVRSFKMAHEKHKKTITAVPCGATDVVCSISAGRPTEIENSAG